MLDPYEGGRLSAELGARRQREIGQSPTVSADAGVLIERLRQDGGDVLTIGD
ncbi:MAG: hypothetical protein AAF899_04255 [Pseudomonadota bacterium]